MIVERKIFLDVLPRKEGWGANKGKVLIDWTKSIGHKIRFFYDDIEGELEIVDYDHNRNLYVKYKNSQIHKIDINSFSECRIARIIGKVSQDFKVEIGYKVLNDRTDLVIIGMEYRIGKSRQPFKYYKYKCNRCGYVEGWIEESNLLKGVGCSCCGTTRKKAVLGINTIWDTDRWMVDLGVSEEDAKTHTRGSGDRVDVKCTRCGNKKCVSINDVYSRKSIRCICGDGFSYPEKLIFSVLKQLNEDFETEYSPKWSNNKRYDFYIPSLNAIIETHGMQHYRDSSGVYIKNLKDEQENDAIKKNLALLNGISAYIVLDCRYSELKWIKNSTLNSELVEYFDFNSMDWNKCEEYALKNIIKEVCDYWNNKEEWETTTNLAKVFNMNCTTIRDYLKKGCNLGWCYYSATYESQKSKSKNGKKFGKMVGILKDDVLLGVFPSCRELERKSKEMLGIKIGNTIISSICKGTYPCNYYRGYTFKYI
jgi:ribosomal protein S27E